MEFNIKNLSSTVGAIVAILGAFWALDNHYASAADVQSLQRSMETQIRSLNIGRLEDELFKLDMKKQAQKGKLSPEDEAAYQRHVRKLDSANKEQLAADNAQKK
jgi:hypothetical protein